MERLFARFDATLREAGYLAMGGQIVDATIVAAPKQRNTEAERAAIKAGQIPDGWAEKPAKLRQKDRDARWTVKFSKAKPREEGAPQVDLAVPAFGYKNHVAIDRRHGLIRGWTVSHAAAHDGARLAEVVDARNTAGDVWADTAYRSAKNEAWLAERGLVSRIHRKKPPGRPMAARTRRANARKSAVRSAVEHVFARQKGPMGLVVRTIGIARARVKIGLANLAYNMKRFVWLSSRHARRSRSFQKAVDEGHGALSDDCPAEPGFDRAAPRLAELPAQIRVVNQTAHGCRHRVRRSGRNQQAGLVGGDDLGEPSDHGRDHGQA